MLLAVFWFCLTLMVNCEFLRVVDMSKQMVGISVCPQQQPGEQVDQWWCSERRREAVDHKREFIETNADKFKVHQAWIDKVSLFNLFNNTWLIHMGKKHQELEHRHSPRSRRHLMKPHLNSIDPLFLFYTLFSIILHIVDTVILEQAGTRFSV